MVILISALWYPHQQFESQVGHPEQKRPQPIHPIVLTALGIVTYYSLETC
ncbi:MAG: hypothetical protein WCD18_24365 [Thermosynechococcaceae cyanobacterium]